MSGSRWNGKAKKLLSRSQNGVGPLGAPRRARRAWLGGAVVLMGFPPVLRRWLRPGPRRANFAKL